MNTWKFSISQNSRMSRQEIRDVASDLDGVIVGDDIFISKLGNAFSFQMRVGDMVEVTKIAA